MADARSRDLQHVTFAPNRAAWDVVDVFDDLVDEMERLGLAAHIQEPRDGNYSRGGVVIDPAVWASVYLAARVGETAASALASAIVEFFTAQIRDRARRGELPADLPAEKIGRIFGPDGEILREFELTTPRPPAERPKKRKKSR